MFAVGVTLVALGILFFLTALAFWTNEQLRHPVLVSTALAATIAGGILLMLA
jgi:hypothetical protein